MDSDAWAWAFCEDVAAALRPFRGKRVCARLPTKIQQTLDALMLNNLTRLITVKCDDGYEVRVPGSFELLGRVDPNRIEFDQDGGVKVAWVVPAAP